jgi:glycosyltransferase involved in cell wall biosynthesis
VLFRSLAEGYMEDAWRAVAERAGEADGFIAVSKYYRDEMVRRLGLKAERVRVVYNGLDVEGYGPADAAADPPAVGFLQRMCPQMGLDVLVQAFGLLKGAGRFDRLKLRVAGGKTADDEPYIATCRKELSDGGWAGDAEFLDSFDRDSRIAMLRGLTVFSVPTRHHSAFGLHALEALAAGVPVVLPPGGASEELAEATGGALVSKHNDAASLALAMESLLNDPAAAREMGRRGRAAVLKRFTVERMAQEYAAACLRAAGE